MKRFLAGVVAVVGGLVIGSSMFASAAQLAVQPASLTPTMVATIGSPLTLALNNRGTTAGRVEASDRILVSFPRALDASTLCSTWAAAPSTTQSITANNALTVTITDGGAANDTLSIGASGVCGNALGFGTVDLGSTAFVTGGNLTFSGSGSSGRTSLTYDPTRFRITLTLGARSGSGAPGTVGSVTAVYAPGPTLQYGDGTTVAPSTGTTTGVAL